MTSATLWPLLHLSRKIVFRLEPHWRGNDPPGELLAVAGPSLFANDYWPQFHLNKSDVVIFCTDTRGEVKTNFFFLPLAAGHARSFNKNPKNIAKSQSWKNELMSVSRPPKKGEQDNNMFVWTHLRFGSCQHTASTRPAQREKGHQDRSRQLNNRKKAGILFSCVSTL